MKLSGNKILVTGGSSGIGFEMSKKLVEKGNQVIVCSRSVQKLEEAQKKLPGLIIYPCDIADEAQCQQFVRWLRIHHPDLNVLVNNAAIVHRKKFMENTDALANAKLEMETNFFAPLRLIKWLYPVLRQQENAAVINITTGLVYIPRAEYAFYNSTKSALHAFTQVLREQLKNEPVQVIEVLFPVVDTPWHAGDPPKIAISPTEAVNKMLKGLEKNKKEIRVGKVKLLYFLSRIFPRFAFRKLNSLE